MIENKLYVTTVDGNTYDLGDKDRPQIWEVELGIRLVSNYGATSGVSPKIAKIHVERQQLINAGLLPVAYNDELPIPETSETVEDLILRLLSHVGVFPEQ